MLMLTCTKCKREKSETEFGWRKKEKNIRQSWCKLCYSQYSKNDWKTNEKRRKRNHDKCKERRKRNHDIVYDYLLTHPCIVCGEKDPIVLDFDHRDSKSHNISDMSVGAFKVITLIKEINKCDVLCANCHRRRTAEQYNWSKWTRSSIGRARPS